MPLRDSPQAEGNAGGNDVPRVLLISDRYLPEVGGSITWFHNVYTRHPEASAHVVTNWYPGARKVDASYPRVRMHRVSLKRYRFLKPESLILYLKLFLTSIWIVLRHRIQVVHAGKNLPEGFVARLLRRILGVPYVVYAHGEEITVFSGNPKLRPHLAPIYTGAAAVIANSRFTSSLVRELGVPEERIARISPGVDPEEFRPLPPDPGLRRDLGAEGKVVLLTVGRLQKRKGHDMVISALPSILAGFPDLVYVMAGDGEEREALGGLAESKGVRHAVRFLGRVPQADLLRLYNACDIFIMASRMLADGDVEGFGIVYLEAGACEKPVIAGSSGGTAEAVEDGKTGLLVDGSSEPAIAEAVVRLAQDESLRRRMGEAGRARVKAEYTWDAIARRTIELNRKVLSE